MFCAIFFVCRSAHIFISLRLFHIDDGRFQCERKFLPIIIFICCSRKLFTSSLGARRSALALESGEKWKIDYLFKQQLLFSLPRRLKNLISSPSRVVVRWVRKFGHWATHALKLKRQKFVISHPPVPRGGEQTVLWHPWPVSVPTVEKTSRKTIFLQENLISHRSKLCTSHENGLGLHKDTFCHKTTSLSGFRSQNLFPLARINQN